MTEDDDLVYSPLNRRIVKDGQEIEICIYKGESDASWCLEVLDQFDNSTCWNEQFTTDQAAYDEVLATIQAEGISALVGPDPNETVH